MTKATFPLPISTSSVSDEELREAIGKLPGVRSVSIERLHGWAFVEFEGPATLDAIEGILSAF